MTDRNEGWRTVPGHPDYEVSNLGRVRSWKRSSTPHLLTNKPHIKLGYCFVRLDGKSYGVHQVVALAFNGPRPDGLEVDHINSIRNDNRPENLRYVTRQENLADRKFHNVAECTNGHQMSGPNIYIRPSNGRRECRACAKVRTKKPPSVMRPCSTHNCLSIAIYRVRAVDALCSAHYQRGRRSTRSVT